MGIFERKCQGKYFRHQVASVGGLDRYRIISRTEHGAVVLMYLKGKCLRCGKEGIMTGSSSFTSPLRVMRTNDDLERAKYLNLLDEQIGYSHDEWI